MKRLITMLVLFSMLSLVFNGCVGEANIPAGNVLRVALHDNPTNLDPRTHTDAVSYRIIELVYDFLVRTDSTGLPELGIAQNLDISEDVVYRFDLSRDLRAR